MSAHALIVEPFGTLAFMRAALVACLALALTNGTVGTLLVLRRMGVVSSVIVLAIAALYRPLAVGAFDPAFLRAAGVRAPYGAVFLALVVLGLVSSFQAFGTLLAVGPMLLPAAAARCWGLGV